MLQPRLFLNSMQAGGPVTPSSTLKISQPRRLHQVETLELYTLLPVVQSSGSRHIPPVGFYFCLFWEDSINTSSANVLGRYIPLCFYLDLLDSSTALPTHHHTRLFQYSVTAHPSVLTVLVVSQETGRPVNSRTDLSLSR